MKGENLQIQRPKTSRYEKVYLGTVVLMLGAIVAYFVAIATAGQTAQAAIAQDEDSSAGVPLLGLAYTAVLWVVVPTFLVYRLWRKTPRRGQILVAGEELVPAVYAKKSNTPEAPKREEIASSL
jgi:hypothetical protein